MFNLIRIFSFFAIITLALVAFVPAANAAARGPTIVDVLETINETTGEFSTLLAAFDADPLIKSSLSGKGQFTLFAPTDDAFLKLGLNDGNIGSIDEEFLRDVLLYHVARGRRDSTDVIDSDRIRTLFKGFVLQDSGVLTDNLGRSANIIVVDVLAANGIIHYIDTVLLPYIP